MLGRYAAERRPDMYPFYDLEEEFQHRKGCLSIDYTNKNGAQACLDACQEIIQQIASQNIKRNCLIEVCNSAFTDASMAFNWLLHSNHTLLTIYASPSVLSRREPLSIIRTPEDFLIYEYCPERRVIYNLARPNYLDVSNLTELEAKEKFLNFLENELFLVSLS
jgi:hypothetical protein